MKKVLSLAVILFAVSFNSFAKDTKLNSDEDKDITTVALSNANQEVIRENVIGAPVLFIKNDKLFVSYLNPTEDKVSITFTDGENNILHANGFGHKNAISTAYSLTSIDEGDMISVKIKSGSKKYTYEIQK
ncbi:hypothetical protein K5X82_12455 [Halosquirtibacter xylanolyticus]|uniref:hypothetical protein n=1 Tax=Halosquirtibacter xylanolyticus TaxID=3374599 RepID=UPI003748E952|nr:hypothetical protein K5X82_12455 [Prolixibacteraceae bacterium]